MGKENSTGATNRGENSSNRRRTFYRKKTGNADNNVVKPKVQELMFYLHDSAARKTSESFGRIKVSITLKIQKSFEKLIGISESIIGKVKTKFSKPDITKRTAGDADVNLAENAMFLEEWKTYFSIYRNDGRKFCEAWVKAYALIWDTYCLREVQLAIKEMPAFDTTIINYPLLLLETI